MSESGKIIIITAPSGSGKTTLVKRLLDSHPQLSFSISACTRQPRVEEVHGKDYYFYSPEKFRQLIEQDSFVEWEMVYTDKYYGTLRSELTRLWNEHRIPVVDIDVHGALNVQDKYKGQSLSIFIKTPSIEELRKRLEKRGTESPEMLEERVHKASKELVYAENFNEIIVNDDLDTASQQLKTIVDNFLLS